MPPQGMHQGNKKLLYRQGLMMRIAKIPNWITVMAMPSPTVFRNDPFEGKVSGMISPVAAQGSFAISAECNLFESICMF